MKIIERWRKKDYYVEYMVRKYEKMELITKEGILRPRLLDYAEIILAVEEKLRSITRLGNVLNRATIKNYVKMYTRREKIPTSIVGEELMTQEVDGILSLWKSYFKLCGDFQRLDRMRDSGKIDQMAYQSRADIIQQTLKDLMDAIQSQLEELNVIKK